MAPLKLTIPSDNTQGIILITIQIALSAIAFVVYLLRVLSHKVQRRWQVWSDILCGLGLIGCFALCFIMWTSWSDDIGMDLSHFTYADAINSAKVLIWNFACVCVRISVVLLYLALFTNHPIFNQACYFFIALNVASFVAIVFAASFICRPVLYVFDKAIPNGHCGNVATLEHAMAFWNLIADFMLVLLPQWIIWTLQMHSKKKLGLSIIFAMGSMICMLTIIRLVLSYHYETDSFTKQAGVIGFITAIEPTLGVIAASLPYMPAVVLRVCERLSPYCQALPLPLLGCGCARRKRQRRRCLQHDAWHGYDEKHDAAAAAAVAAAAAAVASMGRTSRLGRASRASRRSRANTFSHLHDIDVRSGNFDSSFRNEYKVFRVGPPSETDEDVTPDEPEGKELAKDGISVRQTVTVVSEARRHEASSRERERQMLTSMDRDGRDGRWSRMTGTTGALRSADRDSTMTSPSPGAWSRDRGRGRSSTESRGAVASRDRGTDSTVTSPQRGRRRGRSGSTGGQNDDGDDSSSNSNSNNRSSATSPV